MEHIFCVHASTEGKVGHKNKYGFIQINQHPFAEILDPTGAFYENFWLNELYMCPQGLQFTAKITLGLLAEIGYR